MPLDEGARAPDFELPDAGGTRHDLAKARRKAPVLAAFYKAGCPTCQLTFPYLERLHRGYAGEKFELWGISQDNPEKTKAFAQEKGLTFPLLVDAEPWPVSDEYELGNVPSLFLVEPDGTISWQSIGFDKARLRQLSRTLAERTGSPVTELFPPGDSAPDWKPG